MLTAPAVWDTSAGLLTGAAAAPTLCDWMGPVIMAGLVVAAKHVARAPPKAPAMAHGACVCHIASKVRKCVHGLLAAATTRVPPLPPVSHGRWSLLVQVGPRQADGAIGSMLVLSAGSDNCVKLWRQKGALRKCVFLS